MTGKLKDLTINYDQSQNLTVTINYDFKEEFDKLKNGEVDIEIKKASKHRSMDANNYLWWLCSQIAKVSSKYSTDGKNEVYREAIQAKGEFEPVLVKEEAVEKFLSRWNQKGTGWFAEVIDDYIPSADYYSDVMGDNTNDRYKIVHAYYGSSTYDSTSMSRIIDYVVNIANDLGIATMTDTELNKTLLSWQKKVERHE